MTVATENKTPAQKKREEIIQTIYEKFFLNIEHNSIDIFLCGAASSKQKTSCRDELRNRLKNNKNISIYYPEDIFIELMNKNIANLFFLEQFLADNSNLIIIVCESVGSYTELGAFTNNEKTVDKVVAIIDNKEKKSNSFVTLGPVRYIENKNEDHVIIRNSNIDELVDKVYNVLEKDFGLNADGSLNRKKKMKIKDINLISGQFYFILIILYFFDIIETTELVDSIKGIYSKKNPKDKNFDFVFTPAIKRLYNENMIVKERINNKSCYHLTSKGFKKAKELLKSASISDRDRAINRIRMEILKENIC